MATWIKSFITYFLISHLCSVLALESAGKKTYRRSNDVRSQFTFSIFCFTLSREYDFSISLGRLLNDCEEKHIK